MSIFKSNSSINSYNQQMDKINKKKLTNKTSLKVIKNKKGLLKTNEQLIVSARTPRSGRIKADIRKYPIEKFKSIKSIPTITYREIETTIFPSQINENQQNFSYLNHTECKLESQIQQMKHMNVKRLLSDRRDKSLVSSDKNKEIFDFRMNKQQKMMKKMQNSKKQKRKQRRNTTLNIFTVDTVGSKEQTKNKFESILKRTKQILVRCKNKEMEWQKEKKELIKELQRYKRKANQKSTTTATSSHNSQSHKYLF